MPFKDNANEPAPEPGWDGARSARLGAAVLQPMLRALRRGEVTGSDPVGQTPDAAGMQPILRAPRRG